MRDMARQDQIIIAVGGALFLVGLFSFAVFMGGSARKQKLLAQLASQVTGLATLEARHAQVSEGLTAVESKAFPPDTKLPRMVVSEALIGEAFSVQEETQPLANAEGWQRQSLVLTSHSLPASKFLGLLPRLCSDEHGFVLTQVSIRAIPGRRGLVEVEARFGRLLH
jgi:hypothetical protein